MLNKTEWITLKNKHHIGFVKTTNGVIDIWNKKNEFLGIVFYYKDWKEWCFIQDRNIIMSLDCLQGIVNYCKNLNVKEWENFEEKTKIPECKSACKDLLNTLEVKKANV